MTFPGNLQARYVFLAMVQWTEVCCSLPPIEQSEIRAAILKFTIPDVV
jgi:hypothetical protein